MTIPRVLAIYGHPDDEGQVGGMLATATAEGCAVTLVCATRGEVGEISDPLLATPETLWYTRELELRAAMAQLGVFDVRFLPFRDSGMEGTPENEDPRSLAQAPADQVVGQIVALLREVRPHAVFTWDPTGGYGHPDHIAVHRHTVSAFDAAGDPAQYPDSGAAWQPGRLYWGARGFKQFAKIFLELEERGLLPEPMEPERRERMERALAEPDPPSSHSLDVSAHAERKRRATMMHRSQFGEGSMFNRIPAEMRAAMDGQERYYQARPAWVEGTPPRSGFDALVRELAQE